MPPSTDSRAERIRYDVTQILSKTIGNQRDFFVSVQVEDRTRNTMRDRVIKVPKKIKTLEEKKIYENWVNTEEVSPKMPGFQNQATKQTGVKQKQTNPVTSSEIVYFETKTELSRVIQTEVINIHLTVLINGAVLNSKYEDKSHLEAFLFQSLRLNDERGDEVTIVPASFVESTFTERLIKYANENKFLLFVLGIILLSLIVLAFFEKLISKILGTSPSEASKDLGNNVGKQGKEVHIKTISEEKGNASNDTDKNNDLLYLVQQNKGLVIKCLEDYLNDDEKGSNL